jgi:hypothetical protein
MLKDTFSIRTLREKSSDTSSFHVPTLIVLSLALNLYGINWGLPNGDIDWAPDSVAPLGPLAYAKRLLHGEYWYHKYAPFHFLVLAVLYSPYVLYLFLTGGLSSPTDSYPYGLADPEFSLAVFTLIARVTSAFMGMGVVLVNYYTVKRLYGSTAALLSGLFIASSYGIIHYSHNANIDIPSLFWASLALYSFVSLLQTRNTKYYMLLGLFTALSFATKQSIFALFIGLILPLLWFHFTYLRSSAANEGILSLLFHRQLLYGLLALVVASLFIFNPLSNWEGFIDHINFHLQKHGRGSRVVQEAENAFEGYLTLLGNYLTYILQSNGPLVFVLLLIGFFYCLIRYPGKSWIIAMPILTYWIFFLRTYGHDHLRHVLPAYLLLTWLGGKFAADFLETKKVPKIISVSILLVIVAHSTIRGFSVGVLYTRDPRYAAEQWMEQNIPRSATILGVHPDYSLPRFPDGWKVVRRRLWDYDGNRIADITDIDADYIVINMSLSPRAQPNKHKKYKDLKPEAFSLGRGYREVASFKTEVPFFGVEIPDLASINPRIVIFKKSYNGQ